MKLTPTKVAIVLGTAALAAGCGGGGGSPESTPTVPMPVNAAPTISSIASQTIDEGSATDVLAFTIGDAETAPDALTISVSSSNGSLVQADGLEMTGTGSNRALTIFPAEEQSGASTITISVRDSGGATSSSKFELTVAPLLRAQFSEWFRGTVLPNDPTGDPVGEPAEGGQALPQVQDINRIRIRDDAASFDDLIPPEEPDEA
jgi:hypothetical protein